MAKKKDYRELLKTPFDTGIRNFAEVAKYFLYYTPSIDSAHSSGPIPDNRATELLAEMLDSTGLAGNTRFLKRILQASWKNSELDEYVIDFEKSRMLCDMYNNENELHALLRHIRNSLAHGYVYVWKKKKGNFIMLVDYDAGKHKPTAKILITSTILEQWKAILENEIV
ncbi:MAG: hypothetical protein GX685_04760 [Clostridiales bacterium]|nr:hypothetical protein [Clostridiales bacterium]